MSIRLAIVAGSLLLGAAGACASDPDGTAAEPGTDWFQVVTQEARNRAQAPYRAPESRITPAVADLSYGQLRGISFRREAAIWRGAAPFEVQLFHPGGGFDTPVRIHLVEGDSARLLSFDPSLFRYGDEVEGLDLAVPAETGFPGFRLLHPMNDPERMDEVVSFLGASYFRVLGPGHVYGLSARGLAVDVAGREGEEFPDFVAFWLLRPEPGDEGVTFFGLLDGPSVTGAYHFHLLPGQGGRGTVLEVDSRLFARDDVARLGVAPLTSMYLHGTFRSGGEDDVRPRVHDSEGLLMANRDGEWIWRPLTNGRALRVTSLRDVDPAGFGLAQRERDFDAYLDLEAQYHRRPSLWVETEGAWGGGGVELVEFPTRSEFEDNVVAYWSPDGGLSAGEERSYRYRLITFGERLERDSGAAAGQTLAQVARTRIGWDGLPGQVDPPPPSWRRVVVDFHGGGLPRLTPRDSLAARLSLSSGSAADVRIQPLPDGGRRATFSLRPLPGQGSDMRLYLTHADTAVTETWSYLWEPNRAG